MKRLNSRVRLVVCVLVCLCTMGMGVEAKEAAVENQVADTMIGSGTIHWTPKTAYNRLELNVSGPEGVAAGKTFDAGASPYFSLSDLKNGNCPDGMYTYELKAIPYLGKRVRGAGAAESKPLRLSQAQTQTGYFMVRGGSILVPSGTGEGIARVQDIVHNDDVIIDGSLCVGNDCYSGLAFGFDTIVLMENNLRIFFDDTSTIQNYPRNDWRIIVNDSTDSGGKYFAIEDATEVSNIFVLEAGAPDNSLYVDSHGDVGINTSTPYYELHIVDGDSPCVRLEQDGSYGWTPQKWDVCGNESNFFIRDATHASKLPFRIEPEAPTDSIFIKSNGYIGFGTGSPGYPFELETTGENAMLYLDRTDGAKFKLNVSTGQGQIGTHSNHKLNIVTNNTNRITIAANGDVGIGQSSPSYLLHLGGGAYCDGGAWIPGSSREYKENISPVSLSDAMATLKVLDPVKYNYKTNPGEDYLGFIAEDVPELVATKERKGINTMDVVAVLTKVVQEQQRSLSQQQNALSQQQKLIQNLQKEISHLKENR